jgi:Ser/Thr protein kinase RdoA (MazF antagonist)
MERAREWRELTQNGWLPHFAKPGREQVHDLGKRAWILLQRWAECVPRALAPWADRTFPLQPCLCDIWHDHILFEEETVRGFIDFGGVKIDHVSVDLARLLGSMIADDCSQRNLALETYARVRPLSADERSLVTILDETGTVIGIENWLKWLYRDGKPIENLEAAASRLRALVERIDKWDPAKRLSGNI